LSDISALQNIDLSNISNLRIVDNQSLSFCNLPNICAYLDDDPVNNPRTISGNSGACLNETSLQIACSALPLDLLSFIAQETHTDAILNWQTSNEVNASHLEVQRGYDGLNFQKIGETKAGRSDYAFTDKN